MTNQISKNKKILFLLLLLGVISISITSTTFALEANWPNSPAGTALNDESDITILIKYLYEWGITLGGLAAFIALVIAGFQYLTSVGDPSKMKEATERIKSAVLGLVLLLSSFLILNTINPELTILKTPSVKPIADALSPEKIDPNFNIPSCDKIVLRSEPNYTGPRQEFDVPIKGTVCKGITIKPDDEKSIEILYRDKKTGELIQGGLCRVVLYSQSHCGILWAKNVAIYSSVPNTKDLFLPKQMDSMQIGRIEAPKPLYLGAPSEEGTLPLGAPSEEGTLPLGAPSTEGTISF